MYHEFVIELSGAKLDGRCKRRAACARTWAYKFFLSRKLSVSRVTRDCLLGVSVFAVKPVQLCISGILG